MAKNTGAMQNIRTLSGGETFPCYVSKPDGDAKAAMHTGLDDHPKLTLHDYKGLDHGFAAQFGTRRDEEAATLADQRTEAFFKEHLA